MCALFVHTTNLPEDYYLMECDSLWSVRHTYPSVGCIPQEDAFSIFRVALSSKMSVHMYQSTCHHLPQDSDLHSYFFEGSKLTHKISYADQLLTISLATTAVAISKNIIVSKLHPPPPPINCGQFCTAG
jgi:hypothetical protein